MRMSTASRQHFESLHATTWQISFEVDTVRTSIWDIAIYKDTDRTYLRMLACLQAEAYDELQLRDSQLGSGIVQAAV